MQWSRERRLDIIIAGRFGWHEIPKEPSKGYRAFCLSIY